MDDSVMFQRRVDDDAQEVISQLVQKPVEVLARVGQQSAVVAGRLYSRSRPPAPSFTLGDYE